MEKGINVFVNNKETALPENASISHLLETVSITSHKGIALAVNNNVIPKAEWENYVLASNDKVTLIRATQGG